MSICTYAEIPEADVEKLKPVLVCASEKN